MDMLAFFHIKKPDVVHETIDGETVIVNLDNGIYYSLRNSGVDVWNMLEDGANVEDLMGMLLPRYAASRDEIQKAVEEFLVTLQQEGLVRASSTRPAAGQVQPAADAGQRQKFEPPLLEKYSDMQELLLLDPIHEVDEEGWPHKADGDAQGNAGPG